MSGSDARRGRASLTGWGRATASVSQVVPAGNVEQVVAAVRSARASGTRARGVLARGLGRSYGDAATNAGGCVVDTRGLRGIGEIAADGTVEVAAGVSVGELMARTVPRGWFVPVTPGTRHVTVGGAVAADVHGKNHHRDGSIGSHLVDVTVVDGRGEVRRIGAGDPLMGAVVGGMGLSGVVVSARIRLIRVSSASITVETRRTPDLDATLAALAEDDRRHRYTVAWLDTRVGGRSAGRGVLTSGDHSPADEPGALPLRDYTDAPAVPAPAWAPPGLVNRVTTRAFNELWFRRAPRHRTVSPATLSSFFHPLDVVGGWNRLYGRPGFVQYQLVVEDPAVVEAVLDLFRRHRVTTFLPVLKRFGPESSAPLSFPRAGWTLAVDLPAVDEVAPVLDRVDRLVVEAGGRCYLAKDARVRPQLVPAMYPRLDDWRELRARLDPDGVFVSDLSRRLSLC